MTSRHIPNEHERQPSCSRYGYRCRLQTIMEADSSAARGPVGTERKQQLRGVKRPLQEKDKVEQASYNNGKKTMTPKACVSARRCSADNVSSCQSRPPKRPVPDSKTRVTTPSTPYDKRKAAKTEPLTACQAEVPKRNMKSFQVSPSGGGVPKLIRNHVKPDALDQRAMHKQLQLEHLQLQKTFALWRQLVEEAQSHKNNQELASWAEEKEGILKSTKALQSKVVELQEKLAEYREQNELLEFRILELDHCQTKQCPPCGASMTSPQEGFCSTGCSQPEDPCLRLFQDQVALYQDLEFRADELLEELRLLSALPGLSCSQRSALARSAACVFRCKGEVKTTLGLLPAVPQLARQEEPVTTNSDQALFLGSEWLEKLLFGAGTKPESEKGMDDDEADLSDQSLLQETSMTESEIGQALTSEWPVTATKNSEQPHSEDEGLGEDSRRSTEPNSLISEDQDVKTPQNLIEDLRQKNSVLKTELRQAEILIRTLKAQADKVQDLENQLRTTERERSEYQEQILELEEAENDARLESQTLRGLVENLRQREDDLEKNLCDTRDRLEVCEQRASCSGASAEELRLQVRYLEELVYKYEEHIEGLEKAEADLHRKLMQSERDCVDIEVQVGGIMNYLDVAVQVEVDDPLCKCPQKKDLLARLQTLEEKDGVLREQLHQVDGINLKLWQKLYCLETDIGECKRQEGSWGPEQHHREAAARLESLLGVSNRASNEEAVTSSVCSDSENEIGERLMVLECNERKLREQLLQLEQINQDFERELEIRERLNRDKEFEQSRWIEREKELRAAIEELESERVSLREQTVQLEAERTKLREALEYLQEEYGRLKLSHCQETQDLHTRHQEASQGMHDSSEAEDFQEINKMLRLSQEALQIKTEQEELRTQVAEMSLAFETELRALRACHELEEKHLHDEMVSLRCRDDQCCSRVQALAAQREKLEVDLSEREQQLQALTLEFQRKSIAMDEERNLVEKELQRKLREMEESTSCAVKELEEKRKQLETSLRMDMEDLRCKESSYKIRIHDLEHHVDSLRHEITSIAQGFSSDDYSSEEGLDYRNRIEELEKKEAAYVETLENADKIISQMELRYRDNIQRLERSERSLQERVLQLETTESELRSALHNERRSSDSGRVADIIKDLQEAETRENSLKEHADELEATHKTMLQKIRELEKANQQLQEELHDHEELSVTAAELRQEQERLKEEINRLRKSENALKETLHHADEILAQREQLLTSRVSDLETEKRSSEEMIRQLRDHVRSLQEQLDQSQLHQMAPRSGENAQSEVSREEISDLKLEVRRLQQCLSANQAQVADLDTVRRNQERVIEQLEESKSDLERRFSQLQKIVKSREEQVHTGGLLHQRVLELEKLIGRSSWSCGETKETQTDRLFYSNSRSVTAPVSPASSVDDLSNYQIPEPHEEVPMEEVACLGMEERIELEHCMKRAMAAMERDLQRKNAEQHRQHPTQPCDLMQHQVFTHDEEDDEDVLHVPPSPACSSTSGCESDCSSSGGSCQWVKGHNDPYVSDEEIQIERHTVTTRELPTLMKTRIIYPSISKAETKDVPALVTRHSEYSVEDSLVDRDATLPEAPSDFCILRRVGRDSLLLGWTPPASKIDSYQILVNGAVHQRVRSPDRTKALLHKLDLSKKLTISIRSLITGPQPQLDTISPPAVINYQVLE